MKTHAPFYRIAAGMIVLAVAPSVALAQTLAKEDYLDNAIHYQDPAAPESADSDETPGQKPYTGGDPTRQDRVNARIDQYMAAAGYGEGAAHDDREFEVTPQQFQSLVKKAQGGDPQAIAGVAYAYQYGQGTEKNEKAAVEWYSRAIDYGQTQYYSTIGDMYRDYSGAEQKQESGFFGDIKAMMSGGKQDSGLQKDNAVAREWYEKGIQHADDWRAFSALGEMYRDGTGGLEKNMTKAQAYYNRGMEMKYKQDEEALRELQSEAALKAVQDVPLVPTQSPEEVTGQDINDPLANMLTVVIGNQRCGYSAGAPRGGYSNVYDLYCPNLGSGTLVKTAVLPGLECEVSQGRGAPQLLCNPEATETVRIGSQDCNLRPENAMAGYSAIYGAYCKGAAETDVEPVTYRNMRCEVEAALAGEGKTYSLKCGAQGGNPSILDAEKKEPEVERIPQRIGSYDCSLEKADSPSKTFKTAYSAYCGGLTQSEKSSGSVPGSISMGVTLCNVEPWPDNDEQKDFELYCR